ncbi:MAG: hypothetical protein WC988_03015 [Patescibacteria group bacterium]
MCLSAVKIVDTKNPAKKVSPKTPVVAKTKSKLESLPAPDRAVRLESSKNPYSFCAYLKAL